jgi:mono/diheme cytochrome c family protein
MRFSWVLVLSLITVASVFRTDSAKGQSQFDQPQLPSNYVPSGKILFKEYCAVCHGAGAKGDGPAGSMLKVPPADLTTLARRHGGAFPYEYVSGVLRFGTGATILHGKSDMPVWGPIFQYYDNNNESAVKQRIKNLCDYLASLQER